MRGNLTWHNTELAAREANGRGERELAIRLMAQSIDEARNPSLPWHELQSALAGSALFHEYVTRDYALAFRHYRESYAILCSNIGADSRESLSLAECMADCEKKLNDATG
ncbi:hypothetical protein V22_19130 [Calycomorphotria hydatis]|uniref:Tetratricopeptide repeat protein n=1 Tax=Calycomorphotria hydatis TaxID=2528027 RepID=A0A517T8G5_9PLAN|nr:hypothetical protein V22_19130 [Calycomorphotria hydatis]